MNKTRIKVLACYGTNITYCKHIKKLSMTHNKVSEQLRLAAKHLDACSYSNKYILKTCVCINFCHSPVIKFKISLAFVLYTGI